MARREKEAEASPEPSRAAGWFVLLALAAVAVAVVFALSTEAGILSLWAAGTAAVWRAARRRKGPDLPLPSPTVAPSRGDVYAVETGRAARVVRGQGGPTIVYPEIKYVTEDELP